MNSPSETLVFPSKGMLVVIIFISMILAVFGIVMITTNIFGSFSYHHLIIFVIGLLFVHIYSLRRSYKNNEKIWTYASPVRDTALYMLLFILIVMMGMFEETQTIMRYFVGIVSIFLFSIIGSFVFYQLLSNKPVLIINEKGIQDFTTILSVGEVQWKDIDDIFIYSEINNKFVGIVLNDHKIKSIHKIKRLFMKRNRLISIPDKLIAISINELFENMFEIWKMQENKGTM